jgi:hypothetical protein
MRAEVEVEHLTNIARNQRSISLGFKTVQEGSEPMLNSPGNFGP